MHVDIGGVLGGVDPGLDRGALDALDDDVAAVHERVERGRRDGEFGYAALDPDPALEDVRRAVDQFDPAAVLTVGVGGSALPDAAIESALAGPGEPPAYVLDNVDPGHTRGLLADLPLGETLVHVVSQSGATAETLANFLVVRERMDSAGVDWRDRTLVTTGSEGPLRDIADRQGVPVLDAPDAAPGRFVPLSPGGLVPVVAQGRDVEALLDGARTALDRLGSSLFDCPPYAYGAVAYALAERGATTNVLLPYAESLAPLAEWLAQLWAESLGKDGWGQTPVRGMGTTDHHSQLQLYCDGPPDKLVTVLEPRGGADTAIPDAGSGVPDHLSGTSLAAVRGAERRAAEAALGRAGRPSVRVSVDVGERGVGRLLAHCMAATVLVAELADVDAFGQPAVEWRKRAARGLLGAQECATEGATAEERTELLVE
jgi:glucose-6-phosphate isomerase